MNNVVVGDADALIAIALENDPHHQRAVTISGTLMEKGISIVFPYTVFPEAITFLKRSLNQSDKAHLINTQLKQGAFQVEYPKESIMIRASEIFDQADSKQNTMFDAIVAATAEAIGADAIFSFDGWYSKLGFKYAGDL